MKIGTVTFWWSEDNYGQLLQCYALLQFLKNEGHEAFLIRYRPCTSFSLLAWGKRIIINLISKKRRAAFKKWKKIGEIVEQDIKLHPRHFEQFRRKYVPSTERVYSYSDLKKDAPCADAYICGSDQIWSYPSPVYFLQFGGKSVKRVAYAPSLGGEVPDIRNLRRMKKYLKGFDFVSSREKSGAKVLNSLGVEASVLPDPTLLLSSDTYAGISAPFDEKEPYLLLYLLGNEISVDVSAIYDFAKEKNLKVRYVASQGRIDSFPKEYPSIPEWLSLVRQAKYVVTNSFHGTVFCLQFNVPFLVLPAVKGFCRMNNRIYDLLDKYELRDRIYQGSLETITQEIDFSKFNEVRANEENRVRTLFKKILVKK